MFKNTFTKEILLFAFIMFFLSIFCTSILYSTSLSLQNQIYNSIDQNTENITSHLDSTLLRLYEQNSSLVSQSNIRKLSQISFLLSEYEQITTIKELREQITSISNSNNFVQYVRIYIHDLNKVINSTSYSNGSFHYFTDEQYEEILAQALTSGVKLYTNPLTQEETLSIFIVAANTLDDFMIELVLSPDSLQQYLSDNISFGDDYYYLNILDKLTLTNIPDELQNNSQFKTIIHNTSHSVTINHRNEYYRFEKNLPYLSANYIRLVDCNTYSSPIHKIYYMVIGLLLCIILCIILFIWSNYRLIHRPMKKLTAGFQEIENRNFSVHITPDLSDDFNSIYYHFNSMADSISDLIEKNYSQKLLLQKAELKQLQTQINPHFLYNSFFLLQSMIKTGQQEESAKMSSMLGKYFRYITKTSMEQVPLSDEYLHASLYAQIQSLRFEGRITCDITPLPKEFENLPVPKLILQPLLENSFQHGLREKLSDGILKLYFIKTDEYLKVVVEDNSDDLADDTILKESIGFLRIKNSQLSG